MIRLALPLALAALFAAAPATAQTAAGAFMENPHFRDPPPKQCNTTFEMQHCAAHDLRVADAQMSARYRKLYTRLKPVAKQRLLAQQRRWLKDRDTGCMAKGDKYQGGSMAPLVIAQCWVSTTRARTRALASWR